MDNKFMERALELARKGRGFVSPNPCVGAVVVRDGEMIGEGWHRRAGEAHAEVNALEGVDAKGADIYVTLEPCCHVGKTGACTDVILKSGVSRVFIGMVDPFAEVSGKGIEILRSAGLEVFVCEEGGLVDEIRMLNQEFIKANEVKLPYVVMKAGVSLDGKTTSCRGRRECITNAEARADGRIERSFCDAVLVGGGTVKADDPELAAHGKFADKDLLRVIVSRKLNFDLSYKIFRDNNVVIFASDFSGIDEYVERGIKVFEFKSMKDVLLSLLDLGILSVYVEGGSYIHGVLYDEFLNDEDLIDKVIFYISPRIIGGSGLNAISGKGVPEIVSSKKMKNVSCENIAGDFKVTGYFNLR